MNIGKIAESLEKLGASIPAGIPWVGPVYAQYLSLHLSQISSEEHQELLAALRQLMELSEEQLGAIRKELQSLLTVTREQIAEAAKWVEEGIDERQKITRLNSAFLIAEYKFESLIKENFLYKFDGSDSPDYLQLLSDDFKNLFFFFFNSSDFICISGRRGVGKTFNSLLISKKLRQEGYKVYYNSVKRASLPEGIFSELTGLINKDFVFIIDDCQEDTGKTEAILERVSSVKNVERPKIAFLIRNDGVKKGNIIDILDKFLDQKVPILEFKERYIDLEFLAELFFRNINMTEKLNEFLSLVKEHDLSKALFKSKNMEFWNMFFRQLKKSHKIKMKEEEFYKDAYNYFWDKEPYLIQYKDILAELLPLFKNDLPVLQSYVENIINTYRDQYQALIDHKVIALDARDWGDGHDVFITSNFHSTKAEILQIVLNKYERTSIDELSKLKDYISTYSNNLYDTITAFYFHEPEMLEALCRDELIISMIRAYLKETKLGKRLDKVIKTFSKLESQLKDKLIDDEIIDSLAEKLTDKGRYLISKVYLFKAVEKFSLSKAHQLYQTFDYKIVIDDFSNDPKGIYSLAKLMEPFKNIYYYADQNGKAQIISSVKEILDGCIGQFIEKFEKHDYFTQFHWFLKRLNGMKLGNYLLEKIPPAKTLEWIRTKDTNTVELRFLFKDARFIFVEIDGIKRNLYHEYFKNSLNYEDARRIFSNKRSGLWDIAMTSAFSYEILANYLYQYSFEGSFSEKVSMENLYIINTAMDLVEKNEGLSDEQKSFIICRIIDSTRFGEKLFKETEKAARKLEKELDIDSEKERFMNYKEKYGGNFA